MVKYAIFLRILKPEVTNYQSMVDTDPIWIKFDGQSHRSKFTVTDEKKLTGGRRFQLCMHVTKQESRDKGTAN